jgi:hypothetical protein
VIVFPLVFRYGMNPAQGVDLVFDVLASVFAEMPGGRLVGTLFFLMLVFAAADTESRRHRADHCLARRPSRLAARARSARKPSWRCGSLEWRRCWSFNLVGATFIRCRLCPLPEPHCVRRVRLSRVEHHPAGGGATDDGIRGLAREPPASSMPSWSRTAPSRVVAIVVSLRYVCPIALAAVLVANLA